MKERIRTCIFKPYSKGAGPVFRLDLYDTGKVAGKVDGSHNILAYTLKMDSTVLFERSDFGSSPLHAVDADETVKSLMGFLTLRPGDTDKEYFEKYTPAQVEYCEQHAESLSCAVFDRFGE